MARGSYIRDNQVRVSHKYFSFSLRFVFSHDSISILFRIFLLLFSLGSWSKCQFRQICDSSSAKGRVFSRYARMFDLCVWLFQIMSGNWVKNDSRLSLYLYFGRFPFCGSRCQWRRRRRFWQLWQWCCKLFSVYRSFFLFFFFSFPVEILFPLGQYNSIPSIFSMPFLHNRKRFLFGRILKILAVRIVQQFVLSLSYLSLAHFYLHEKQRRPARAPTLSIFLFFFVIVFVVFFLLFSCLWFCFSFSNRKVFTL